jgi:hypothetical protein
VVIVAFAYEWAIVGAAGGKLNVKLLCVKFRKFGMVSASRVASNGSGDSETGFMTVSPGSDSARFCAYSRLREMLASTLA